MTALVAHAPAFRLNWPRIGALSGTLSLHVGIIMLLLMPPVAIEMMRRAEPEKPVVFRLIEEKPPEVVKPEPPPPKPPTKVREAPKHVEPARQPEVAVDTPRTPMSPEAPPNTGPSGPPTDIRPVADTAPTSLMYGKQTKVPYPLDALRRGEHGKVLLRVLVGTDGTVQAIEIEKSSGYARLDAAARDAVRHWTFQPGTRNGVAQSAWALVPIAFDLTQL